MRDWLTLVYLYTLHRFWQIRRVEERVIRSDRVFAW
jgi:hypothetical protein